MQAEQQLHGRRISLSGSAGHRGTERTDLELLRRCHTFVYHLTLGILRAGGQLVAFVGDEPLLEPSDTRTAKVFYWTQLEAIAEYLPERSQTHKDRPLLYAIVSFKKARGGMPASRLGLWERLLAESAVEQTLIHDRHDVGGHQRERQAEVADVLVTLGGSKGIFDLERRFRERGAAVVPLDARIGCSSNDADGGEASRELNEQALLRPEEFVPKSLAKRFQNQLPRLSFDRNSPPEELAQLMLKVLVEVSAVAPSARQTVGAAGSPGAGAGTDRQRRHGPLPEKLNFLVLADEWQPNKGGLSTFNRDLCLGLSRAGHRVSLFVPRAGVTAADAESLKKEPGIEIVHSRVTPTQVGDSELLLIPAMTEYPDVVIGHGLVTGPKAHVQHEQYFSASLLVLFVHTSPGEIEHMKGKPAAEAMQASESKEQRQATLMGQADLVVAVGPRLKRGIEDDLHSWQARAPVHEFLPWLPQHEPLPVPKQTAALWIGRADAAELKGLDLAVQALSRMGSPEPLFYIRGIAAQDAEALQNQIKTWSKEKVAFRLQEYTTDAVRVEQSFRRASVVLMPSRSEGFGLVGLEAIARGIPPLASSESGLAEVLLKHGGEAGQAAVVKVSLDDEATVKELAHKLQAIWDSPGAAFEQARKLREALAPHLREQRSISAFIEALREVAQKRQADAPGSS